MEKLIVHSKANLDKIIQSNQNKYDEFDERAEHSMDILSDMIDSD
jgi:hypothetical protein